MGLPEHEMGPPGNGWSPGVHTEVARAQEAAQGQEVVEGPAAAERPPDQAILAAAVAFARALRDLGLSVSVDSELVFFSALAELDVREQSDVYWAARATFVHTPGERKPFDTVFERFWAGDPLTVAARGAEHGESDDRMGEPSTAARRCPSSATRARPPPSTPAATTSAPRATSRAPTAIKGQAPRSSGCWPPGASARPSATSSRCTTTTTSSPRCASSRRTSNGLRPSAARAGVAQPGAGTVSTCDGRCATR